MLMRVRRHPKALGVVVGAAVASLCLVALGVWWSGGNGPTALPLSHRYGSIEGMNVSKFVDSPRQLTLEPNKVMGACSGGGGGGEGGKSEGSGVEVLVVVPSSPYNLASRSAVRESWGAYLPSTWALVFYVGAVNRASIQEHLIAEAVAHKDIAQDPTFVDSYSNLTLKTLAIVSWAHQFCPAANFVFKVDDDVFVNVPKLQGLITCLGTAMRDIYVKRGRNVDSRSSGQNEKDCDGVRSLVSYYTDATTHRYESYVLAGHLYRDAKPYHDPTSKWYVPKASYPKEVLPPFLSGTAYLMSRNILPHLLEGARNTPAIALEDVYLTGLVAAEQLKLRLTQLEGIERFRPRWRSACAYKATLTAHGFTPGELRDATHMTLGVSEGACDGVFTRVGLALNRIVTSLFPRLPASNSLDNADIGATI